MTGVASWLYITHKTLIEARSAEKFRLLLIFGVKDMMLLMRKLGLRRNIGVYQKVSWRSVAIHQTSQKLITARHYLSLIVQHIVRNITKIMLHIPIIKLL